MDEQAGKGGDLGSQRLDFQLLGGLQTLFESFKEHVIISIQKGDRADEGNSYRGLGIAYFSQGDFRKAIEYHGNHLGLGKEKGEPMEVSVMPTFHWVTSEKPLSVMKNT